MGFIISQMYKIPAFSGALTGVYLGMHKPISNFVYAFGGTSIDDIVNKVPFYLQSLAKIPVELAPYGALAYIAVQGGGWLARKL